MSPASSPTDAWRMKKSLVALPVIMLLTGCSFLATETVSTIGEVSFDTPLAIPPIADSRVDATGTRVFELTAAASETRFGAGSATPTWGFNGSYLGPTLVADRGERVRVAVTNALDEPTTVHWHGMHLPAKMDGGPHQLIAPGETWSPTWTLDQQAATLWYHPHLHGETTEHVMRGLAGLFLVRDDAEAALDLPREYGVDDVPLIVSDVRFADDGSLDTEARRFVGPTGNELLVNGTLGPYLEVATTVTRLRLLNASSARVYDFRFDDGRDVALIASDGGLLESPVTTDHVQLSPGERAEVLVTMAAGETAVLRSTPPDLGGPAVTAGQSAGNDSFDVLELRASNRLKENASVPSRLAELERPDENAVTAERRFVLDGTQINNHEMEMDRVDEIVRLGATEVWDVTNNMALPHSFHVHDVQFQVLSIGGEAPPAELSGRKDTIYLRPNTAYRLIMRFDDYADAQWPYMFHCHLLWHEDQGMMGQFLVVAPGDEPALRESDHEHGG